MSINQYQIDIAARHAILLQRYAAGLEDDSALRVSAALNAALNELLRFQGNDNDALLSSIQVYRESMFQAERLLIDDILALADDEVSLSVDMLKEVLDEEVSKPSSILNAIRAFPIIVEQGQRITLGSMLSDFTESKAQKLEQAIRDGFTQSKTRAEISKDIEQNLDLSKKPKDQARTLARTGVNGLSAAARVETLLENSDLLEGFEIVATLDDRTTFICASLDGEVLKLGDGGLVDGYTRSVAGSGEKWLYVENSKGFTDFLVNNPFPSYHYNCRTTLVGRLKSKFKNIASVTGDRPAVGSSGPTTVPGNTAFSGWLRRQSREFKLEYLGETRLKLFEKGGITIDKFVNFDGKKYTIEELRALYPLVFNKLNL